MWICPECRALYRTKESTCQRDGFALVPVQANLSKAKYPLLEKVVDGRYQLIAGLGQGGLGTVYLALHIRLEQLFAIKFLDLETVGIQADAEQSEEYRRDFMEEARVASLIHHDSVVRVTDFGEFEGLPYLVMEFVAGTSLLGMLGHRGRFKISEAINIAWGIAEALGSFHERKLIHRDLKPANVILDPRGGHLTLVDLGLVKDISGYGGKASTHPMALRGTPGYLAPEQVPSWVLSGISTSQSQTKTLVDARVDMYALGVMLYEMIAGVSPYPDGSNTQIIIYACTKDPLSLRGVEPPIDLPEALEQLIYDTMARDPDRRPSTAADFIQRLKAVTGGERPRDWPEVIMLTQRSTLQGVLPPKPREDATTSNEPSVLDVFGDDSELSPAHLLTPDSDKTIEADTSSFNEPSFVSVDMHTSISGLDSRSRYHTAELRRSAIDLSGTDQSVTMAPQRSNEQSAVRASQHGHVGNVVSETVGDYAHSSSERSVFRYGFYIMLVLLIGVLTYLVFQRPKPMTNVVAPSPTIENAGLSEQVEPAVDEKVLAQPDAAVTQDAALEVRQNEDANSDSQTGVVPKADTQQIPPVDKTKAETEKRKIDVVVKKPKVKKVTKRRARNVSTRQGGRPHTRMGLDELKRRGDAALSTRDCAGAVTYYRKFLERAPNTHPERERVLTRVGSCQK